MQSVRVCRPLLPEGETTGAGAGGKDPRLAYGNLPYALCVVTDCANSPSRDPAATKRPRLPFPAEPDDLVDSLSFALRFEGRKSQHDSDRLNADIVAKRLVRYLDKAGYVVMKKPPVGGHDQVARGFAQK